MGKVRRVALLAAVASLALGVAGVAQASAKITWAQGNGSMTWKGSSVTVKQKGGSSVSCTWSTAEGLAENHEAGAWGIAYNELWDATINLKCANGKNLKFWAEVESEKALVAGSQYAVNILGNPAVARESPFGTYYQSTATPGVYLNGSGSTMSTLTFKEARLGEVVLAGGSRADLLLSGTITVSRGTGLLTLTGS